jgi:hypothetical protein
MAREAKYPAQISALVPQDIRDRIDALEREHPLSGGDIIREALAEGLTSVEQRIAKEAHALRENDRVARRRGALVGGRGLEEVEAAGGEL